MRVKISPSARRRRSRLIDVTGVTLLPGRGGRFCPGNGRHAAADHRIPAVVEAAAAFPEAAVQIKGTLQTVF